ncbi:SDR family NAD(P)-dependent oxidoreductase [Yersinia enterocolitica]|uniref:3-hydroxy acid dehydrogenase n=1 Tax=Yersinia enterocolitica TaxID=630 RepID=A0A0H5H5V7_YEREN|nr:SDR family NAD(P)-dependent oxidoreductase [Yersinia enterocolitica]EKN3330003.1 SDR family NAD(P)-dependent oxidoreductase [Yersinia enterocolitica]EKN3495971.1 SDR family NAD(P)-dependent oxidoreductase [Yersinia enterocolitica]EKN3508826.1 SDR family NAD(P)-dependent oxidoreductase [Yersinia enterocolitica]EKN3557085.1 SDR family NAD(P)-dependent oxidoreductase [Yersinia enterocolitica]EKN3692618.1 SDR family NAD(P)-dependent oxidoreductase [Yersinia enterocolitica]
MNTIPAVLITGASSGIGATYAERFARRGHDLVLVARDGARLETLAAQLRQDNGITVDVLPADLTQPDELAAVETRLRDDNRIGILVNNAGMNISGSFIEQATDDIERIITLNTTALARLASAVAPRLAAAGEGAIINIGSVVGLAPSYPGSSNQTSSPCCKRTCVARFIACWVPLTISICSSVQFRPRVVRTYSLMANLNGLNPKGSLSLQS